MKNRTTFLLTFSLVVIMVGIILYLLFREPQKVIVYREKPEIIFPVRHPIERPWWSFGGLPMKPSSPPVPSPPSPTPSPPPPSPTPLPPTPPQP